MTFDQYSNLDRTVLGTRHLPCGAIVIITTYKQTINHAVSKHSLQPQGIQRIHLSRDTEPLSTPKLSLHVRGMGGVPLIQKLFRCADKIEVVGTKRSTLPGLPYSASSNRRTFPYHTHRVQSFAADSFVQPVPSAAAAAPRPPPGHRFPHQTNWPRRLRHDEQWRNQFRRPCLGLWLSQCPIAYLHRHCSVGREGRIALERGGRPVPQEPGAGEPYVPARGGRGFVWPQTARRRYCYYCCCFHFVESAACGGAGRGRGRRRC